MRIDSDISRLETVMVCIENIADSMASLEDMLICCDKSMEAKPRFEHIGTLVGCVKSQLSAHISEAQNIIDGVRKVMK